MAIPKKVRQALCERSSGNPERGRCEICGRPGNNAHHRKNLSQSGRDALSNLMLLCGSGVTGCHGQVTHKPRWAYAHGYSVRSFQEPAEVPVRLRGRGYVLLTDDGSVVPVQQEGA